MVRRFEVFWLWVSVMTFPCLQQGVRSIPTPCLQLPHKPTFVYRSIIFFTKLCSVATQHPATWKMIVWDLQVDSSLVSEGWEWVPELVAQLHRVVKGIEDGDCASKILLPFTYHWYFVPFDNKNGIYFNGKLTIHNEVLKLFSLLMLY